MNGDSTLEVVRADNVVNFNVGNHEGNIIGKEVEWYNMFFPNRVDFVALKFLIYFLF